MKILALDIGAGTTDILLFDDKKKIENCIKMVLPSPTKIYEDKVREATRTGKDLFIRGNVIGGGTFTIALKNHINKGFRVLMTKNSAYTIRNHLYLVKELGIEIVKGIELDENNNMETLFLEEINLKTLKSFLTGFNEDLSDVDFVAIAVQDHGVSSVRISNRKFRFQKYRDLLKNNRRPDNLSFWKDEIPSCFLRMNSAAKRSKEQLPGAKVLVMDTAPAAILGCLSNSLKSLNSILVVNVGNEHIMAALLSKGMITGLMEHHTKLMRQKKIFQFVSSFADGKLTDEEVFDHGGHGLFYLEEPTGFLNLERIVVTGPNRSILENNKIKIQFAAPAGDMMMTGPVGLVEAVKARIKKARRDLRAQQS
jgi:uncharacterized protein (DUF1786 family)